MTAILFCGCRFGVWPFAVTWRHRSRDHL